MMIALIWILQIKIKVDEWALSDCWDEPKLVSHDSVQVTDLAIIWRQVLERNFDLKKLKVSVSWSVDTG